MLEVEVQVVYGSWLPSETFIEKVERIEKAAHSHENARVLESFITDKDGKLLYGEKYVFERPTAVFEYEGGISNFAQPDMAGNDLLIADLYMDANIPIGAEIKSIEFMYDEEIGWVDIREMQTVDNTPYILSLHRTFLSDPIFDPGITCFAIITFISECNYLYEAAHADLYGKIRITYYTDNIGGENNA